MKLDYLADIFGWIAIVVLSIVVFFIFSACGHEIDRSREADCLQNGGQVIRDSAGWYGGCIYD